MENTRFTQWCRSATLLIRFTPDRNAVYKELMAHLEDHRDALIEQGMDPEQAQQEAVAAMGDPWELSKQLAQVHPPFWGYAHKFTRIAALVLCVLLLLYTVALVDNVADFYQQYNDGGATLGSFPPSSDDLNWQATSLLHPELSHTVNGYYLHISDALLWQSNDDKRLTFYFQSYHLPTQSSMTALQDFYAVDDQGNRYEYSTNNPLLGNYITFGHIRSASCRRVTLMEIRLVSNDLQWLELRYDRDGYDIAMRIDLTGGETP